MKPVSVGAIALTVLALTGTVEPGLAAETEDRSSATALSGIWGASRIFAPAAAIQVILAQDGKDQVAHVGGLRATVSSHEDGSIDFLLPHDAGAFRGRRRVDGRVIAGHWISEPSGLLYSPFATPLILAPIAPDTWAGTVTPVEQTFSLYVVIRPDADGVLRALLRNPERNQGRFTRLDTVVRDGSRVSFLNADGEEVLAGALDDEQQTLSVAMPWRGGTYDLTRLDRGSAVGFYPRRDTAPYRYRPPLARGDGWAVGHAAAAGLEVTRLRDLVQRVLDTETTSIRTPYIHSLLVARRGKLVLEEYFYGYHADKMHDLRSATKSVTGIMTGLAMAQVEELNLTSPVHPVFSAGSSPARYPISPLTIGHLLSMNSGLDCDDNEYDTPGNEDRMQEQTDQPDWWQYTLDLPRARAPGSQAVYCSAGINLLGGIISRTTGTWLPEFFHTHLAGPMQIDEYHMNLDPLKRGYAGGGMRMKPRDFLKFAQLMLDEGRWGGQQIVPAEWVRRMLQPHATIYEPNDYGYTWWTGVLAYGEGTVAVRSATGNGGQLLILVPELELAVGTTGGNYGDFRTWIAWRESLVPEFVLDAIRD